MANPRDKKKKASSATAKLGAALEFVLPAFKDKGAPYQQFCRISNQQIVAFDGVIALGHPVDEDIQICPHLGQFSDAIKRAGDTLNLTELASGSLSVKGDKLRAVIPCLRDQSEMPPVMPDINCAVIDDRIREGMAAVTTVIKEGDQNTRWIETAALLRANTIFATNGHVCFEFFHGIDLPPNLTIPKAAITAILKSAKPMTGFGFGPKSVTFYFEDGAWLRSQMFTEEYPDIDRLLDKEIGQRLPGDLPDCPPDLFEAVEAVKKFAATSAVYLGPGVVRSHPAEDVGADYPVEGLTGFHVFNAEYMKMIAPHAKRIDLNRSEQSAIFYGDNVRGVIMKMRG